MGNKVSQENNLLRKEKHRYEKWLIMAKNGLESSKEDRPREAEVFLKKKGVPIDSENEDDASEEEDSEYRRKKRKIIRKEYDEAQKKARAQLDNLKSSGATEGSINGADTTKTSGSGKRKKR